MAPDTTLRSSKGPIISFFNERYPRSYRLADLRLLLRDQRSAWDLPPGTADSVLIDFLEEEGLLRKVRLSAEEGQYRGFTRYLWRGCTPLEIAGTLRENGYLSHGTAVFLHGLTEQDPRTLYVNYEQTPKPPPSQTLTQASLDRAFKGKQRVSRYTFQLEGHRYIILSGKNTGRYGVEEVRGPSGEPLQVTNVERTLVDIVVRPAYAGGLFQILEAYRTARERDVSVSRVLATLQALDYAYPYHQSIGFFMERAGFEAQELKPLRDLGLNFNFYLGYGLRDAVLDESWRVFHPQGF